jgi:3-oxoacyl-[acyl-carrier protein] reductase
MGVTYDFSGRTAVVTGGSKGIGRGIAERLKAGGARVWIWDLVPADMEGAGFARVDVTDPGQIADAIRQMAEAGDGIDILVNNAGLTGGTISVENLDSAQWRRIVDVNLTAVFEVSHQVVPLMRRSGWGRIVNIASLAGKDGTPNLSAYSAAKAGVIAFTKSLAKELAETDIRVNSVAPAAAETDILKQMDPDAVAGMIAKSPQKRLARVEEIVEVVLWLCSEACTFNTGAVFDVSGGRAVY